MAIHRIDPESQKLPILPNAGLYGPGAQWEADVTVFDFVPMINEPGKGPGVDKDCKEGPYCMFNFRVQFAGDMVFVRSYQKLAKNTGSKAVPWLKALGVNIADDGSFDDRDVIGKKCILEVKAPRVDKKDPTRQFQGDVVRVIGI